MNNAAYEEVNCTANVGVNVCLMNDQDGILT